MMVFKDSSDGELSKEEIFCKIYILHVLFTTKST